MLYHASLFQLASPDHWLVRFGWMGVDLFFVLSGFLIAGQLFRPFARGSKPNYPRFFGRRLLRTVPAYLVVVAVYFLAPQIRERPDIQPLWQFLTFTENLFITPPLPKAFSHAWSLCVEEQFYLLLPSVVAIVALRPSTAKAITLLTVVFFGGMALRGFLFLHSVGSESFGSRISGAEYMTLIYWPTWARLDALLAGVTAAAIKTFRPKLWTSLTARSNLLTSFGVAGIVASAAFFGSYITWFLPAVFGFPLLAWSIALLVVAASDHHSVLGRLRVPGAAALATGAYSLYLSHKAIFQATAAALHDMPVSIQNFGLAVAILAALAAGTTLYWIVERPFLKLRDKLDGQSRSPLDATEAVRTSPV